MPTTPKPDKSHDKFFLSRPGRLALSWWRLPLSPREQERPRASVVPHPDGDRGGAHAAPVAAPPPDAAGRGRGSTVGSGLPADPRLGHGDRSAAGPEHLRPTRAGGGA